MDLKLSLWQPESSQIIPKGTKEPSEIISYAAQLSKKEQKQIAGAFSLEHYEMGMSFLWQKTLSALKVELSTVGISLISEMLGKPKPDDGTDVEDIISARETIKLAEELGAITATDAMRLRQIHETLNHFGKLESEEELDELEATSALKACIKSVLGRPKVQVAAEFVEFREALENETLTNNDPRVITLTTSPYFFQKLTLNILLNAAKIKNGAQLENSLANLNTILPLIWKTLRDTEKTQVGQTYSDVNSAGKTSALVGIKSALLKVKGFDFVPETIRSDTFLKAAEFIINAHEGSNNFYNEPAAVKNLLRLGSTIPTPALPACMTALLCVAVGNRYGTSWAAEASAHEALAGITKERWQFYFNQVLPGDMRIIEKLLENKPFKKWVLLIKKYELGKLNITNKTIIELIKSATEDNQQKSEKQLAKLINEYYGK